MPRVLGQENDSVLGIVAHTGMLGNKGTSETDMVGENSSSSVKG